MGTFKLNFKTLLVVLLLFAMARSYAGAPTWSRVDYTSSTTFVGVVLINNTSTGGYAQSFTYNPVDGDYIGAFVGTECRMVAKIFTYNSKLYVSSVIQGSDTCVTGEPNCTAAGKEEVTFRLWSATTSTEYSPVKGTTMTNPGGNIGSTDPFPIGKPNTGSSLLTLSIAGASISPAFSPAQLSYKDTLATVPVNPTDYTYTVSSRATAAIVYTTNAADNTTTATITVTAEDGLTKTVYTIIYYPSCTLSAAPGVTFDKQKACANETITATASSLTTGVSFNWYADLSRTTLLATATTFPLTSSRTTVYVDQRTSDACKSALATVTAPFNTLPSTPTVTSPISECVGNTVTLAASSDGTITWYDADIDGNVVSNTTITVPTSAVTYYAEAKSADGCLGAARTPLSINPKPIPTVTASADVAACIGSPTTISASGTATSYEWSNGLGSGASVAVTPTTTTAITYTVTGTLNGCTATDQVVVTGKVAPVVTASADASVCAGSSTTISASGTATSYTWDQNVGSGASKTVTPSQTTTYVATGELNGCYATDTVKVTVNALPTVTLSAVPASICNGESSVLTAAVGGATAASYTWSDGTVNGTGGAVSPSTNTTYTVTGTDNNQCTNTKSITVTVSAKPQVTASADASVCKGSSTTISVTGNASTYTWDNGIGVATSKSVSPAANTVYHVTASDVATGCSSTDSVKITVNTPTPVTITNTDTVFCIYENAVALTASQAGSTFTINGTALTSFNPVSAGKGSHTIICTYLDANQCTSTAQKVFVVNQATLPGVSDTTVTTGSAAPVLVATGTAVTWYDANGNNPSKGNSFNTNVSTAAPSVTTFLVSNFENDCESDTVSVKVTVTNCSLAAPTLNKTAQTICAGESFSAFSVTPGQFTKLKWYKDGATTSFRQGNDFIPDATDGIYIYYVSDSASCEGAKTKVTATTNALPVISITAVDPLCENSAAVTLQATPAGGSFTGDNVSNGSFTPSKVGSNDVTYTATENNCSASKTMSITVNALPTTPVIDPIGPFCGTSDVTLTQTGGVNVKWFELNNTTEIDPALTSVTPGSYTYVAQSNENNCTSTDTIIFVVNPKPALPQVPQTVYPYEINDIVSSITANSPTANAVFTWYEGTDVTTGATYTPKVSTASAGTTVINVSQTVAGCEGDKQAITINVTDSKCKVGVPTVETAVSFCSGTTASITATGATGDTIQWYNSSMQPIMPANETLTTTVDGTFYVTAQNGCVGGSQTVVVTSKESLVATIDPMGPLCDNAAPSIIMVSPTSNGTGTISASAGLVNSNYFNPAVGEGTYTISYAFTSNNGCSSDTTISVQVLKTPDKPEIDAIAPFCSVGNFILTTKTTGIIKWKNSAGNFISTNQANVAVGTHRYYALSVNSTCYSAPDSIDVVVNALPDALKVTGAKTSYTANESILLESDVDATVWVQGTDTLSTGKTYTGIATTSVSICATQTSSTTGCTSIPTCTSIVVSGAPCNLEAPTVTGVKTSYAVGESITLTSNFDATTWMEGSTVLSVGKTFLGVASTNKTICAKQTTAGCSSDTTCTSIVVSGCSLTTPVIAATEVSICPSQKVTLTATGSKVNWYDGSNRLVQYDSTNYTTTVAGKYYAMSVDGNCQSDRDSINVLSISAPTPVITPVGTVCEGSNLVLSQTGGTSVVWYSNNVVVSPTITGIAAGPYTYTAVSSGNGCTSSASVSFTVNAKPAAPTVSGTTSYTSLGGFTDLTATPATNCTIKWYNSCTVTATQSPIEEGVTLTPPITAFSTYSYGATQTDANGCVSDVTCTTIIVSDPNCQTATPAITSSATQSICAGKTATFTTSGTAAKWYNSLNETVSNETYLTTGIAGKYTVSQTINGCESPVRAEVTLVVNALPDASITAVSPLCSDKATNVQLTATTAGGTFSGTNVTAGVFSATSAANYYVTYTVTSAASCTNSSTTTIVVNQKPDAPAVTSDTICSGSGVQGVMTATGENIKWYSSSSAVTAQASNVTTLSSNDAATMYVSQTVNGCESSRSNAFIYVQTTPAPAIFGESTKTICEGGSAKFIAIGSNLTWSDGSTGVTFSSSTEGSYNVTQTVNGCQSSPATVTLIVNELPVITFSGLPETMMKTDDAVTFSVTPTGASQSAITAGSGFNGFVFTPSAAKYGDNTVTYTYTDATTTCSASASATVVISLDKSELIATISDANSILTAAVSGGKIGPNDGQYPTSAKTALTDAITAANTALSTATTQDAIDQATADLKATITAFENSLKTTDRTALDALITSATATSTGATIGTNVGEYKQDAQDALDAAIATATTVKNDLTATQAQINAAVDALQAAIDTFNASVNKAIVVTGVTLPATSIKLAVGSSFSLTYTVTPANATVTKVVWASSNPAFVSVDQSGIVTAIAGGMSMITVTVYTNNTSVSARIYVNATTAVGEVEAEELSLYPTLASDVVYIKGATGVKSVTIVSMESKARVASFNAQADVIMVNVGDLASGKYIALIQQADGNVVEKHFVKK